MNIDEIIAYMEGSNEELLKDIEKANKESINLFLTKKAKPKIEAIFEETVDRFYSDYPGRSTSWAPSGEMYDILDIKANNSNTSPSMTVGFDPSKMSFRNGYSGEDGLYDQAFRKGWHGGADTSKHGDHPKEGVPYLRTPPPYFTRWYKEAYVSNPAPLEDFWNHVEEYWEGGGAKIDLDNAWNQCAKKYGII